MRDDVGLLRAILDDPDDDLPRRAYADWCDDHGDSARADFIRAQLDGKIAGPSLKRWDTSLPPVPRPIRYSRGFVEHVQADVMADWLLSADAWFASTPLRSLAVRLPSLMANDAVRRFKRNAGLRRLRTLEAAFSPGTDPALAVPMLGSPNLDGVKHLVLRREGAFRRSEEFGIAVARAGMRLETLGLPGCSVDLAELLESPRLGGLRKLDLSGNGLDPFDAIRLASCPSLGALRHLDLGRHAGHRNALEDEGVASLLRGGFDSLSSLLLDGNGIRDAGVETLLGWERLPQVRWLSLSANALTERSVIALAGCRDLRGLRSLDLLGIEGLGAGAVEALAQSPHLPPELELRMNLVDVPAADEWAERLGTRFRMFDGA